jgi:hypothetical protein
MQANSDGAATRVIEAQAAAAWASASQEEAKRAAVAEAAADARAAAAERWAAEVVAAAVARMEAAERRAAAAAALAAQAVDSPQRLDAFATGGGGGSGGDELRRPAEAELRLVLAERDRLDALTPTLHAHLGRTGKEMLHPPPYVEPAEQQWEANAALERLARLARDEPPPPPQPQNARSALASGALHHPTGVLLPSESGEDDVAAALAGARLRPQPEEDVLTALVRRTQERLRWMDTPLAVRRDEAADEAADGEAADAAAAAGGDERSGSSFLLTSCLGKQRREPPPPHAAAPPARALPLALLGELPPSAPELARSGTGAALKGGKRPPKQRDGRGGDGRGGDGKGAGKPASKTSPSTGSKGRGKKGRGPAHEQQPAMPHPMLEGRYGWA